MTTLLIILTTILGGIVWDSFFEWTLHRFVMHKPLGGFDYAFKAHAVVHHQTFKADATYHLINEKDKWTIPMAWWNGPILIVLTSVPAIIVSVWTNRWYIALTQALVSAAYYGVYEYLHWCMHLPKERVVERTGIFFRLNGHHLLHHRYMHKNFNVVLPLADLLLGTLLTRSPIVFAQATGPAMPDVQPANLRKFTAP